MWWAPCSKQDSKKSLIDGSANSCKCKIQLWRIMCYYNYYFCQSNLDSKSDWEIKSKQLNYISSYRQIMHYYACQTTQGKC